MPTPGKLRLVDGEIAVRVEGDPVVFLGYWRDEAATAAKVRDGWLTPATSPRQTTRRELQERRSRRRPDLERRLPDRAGRDRGVPDPAPGRVGRGGGRRPRRVRGEVVKAFVVPVAGADRLPSCSRAAAARPHAARALRGPARDRVRRRAAAHRDGEDPPRRVASPRRRAPRLSSPAEAARSSSKPSPVPRVRSRSRHETPDHRSRARGRGRGIAARESGSKVSTIVPAIAARGAR